MKSFFSPAGCAVVGASRDPAKPGHQILASLIDAGFPRDRLYPVNPDESLIAGLPAFPSLPAIPGPVELAVLMVPPRALDAVLNDVTARASERGDLRAVIVTAGGYAEMGTPDGRERQERLVATARAAGVRVMGPNCVGVIDTASRLDTTFLHGVVRRPGPITFVSQSGAVGAWFVQMLSSEAEPVGFAKFVSLGNMADVTMAETLDYLRTDPATGVVGLYLEGTAEPRPLLRSLAALAPDKPVVVLKTGRTESGRQAATSHTGALAGADRLWDGALRQAGALRVERMEEFVDTLRVLAARVGTPAPVPRRPLRVFLVTHAGGPGVYAMDLLAGHRGWLEPALVSAETRAALAATLPPFASVCRPEGHIDMTASATVAQHAAVAELLLADPGVDALLTLDLPTGFFNVAEVAAALAGAWARSRAPATGAAGKLFLPLLLHGKWSLEGRSILERSGLPALASPDRAVAVLANLARLAGLRTPGAEEAFSGDGLSPVSAPESGPAALLAGGSGGTLNEVESAALLAATGVKFAPSRLAATKDEALAAAREIGGPVVLKLCSREIPHKRAVGAVRLNLTTADDLSRAYDELLKRATELLGSAGEGAPGAGGRGGERGGDRELPGGLDGLLVQAQAEPGTEVIVGGLRESLFGPVVAAGPGGTRVGLEAPLLFRLAPLSPAGALRLALEVAAAVAPAGDLDVDSLAAAISGMSRLVVSRPDIVEADLNPLIVYPRGRGAISVDALVRIGTARDTGPASAAAYG